jgi:hypothetical protein
MAHGLEQALDLVLLAFVELHLDPRVAVDLDQPHPIHREDVALHSDAAAEPGQRPLIGNPAHLGVIHARDLEARMGHALGELAVVGEEDETLRREVEPAHREEACHARHEAHDRTATRGITPSGHDPPRLVEHDVDGLAGGLHPHSVHSDVVFQRVGLRAELADDVSVDRDTTLQHEAFGAPSGGKASPRQNLLKSFLHHRDHTAQPDGVMDRRIHASGQKPATGRRPAWYERIR